MENIPLDDEVFPSALAYRDGRMHTAHSVDIIKNHPKVAAVAPYPFSISSAPLKYMGRRIGALNVFWPRMSHDMTETQTHCLYLAAASLAKELYEADSSTMSFLSAEPPHVIGDSPDGDFCSTEATISYHLHKLAVALPGAVTTEAVAEAAAKRVPAAFGISSLTVALLESDRLRVAGSFNCPGAYLRSVEGLHMSKETAETAAVKTGEMQYSPTSPDGSGAPEGRADSSADWLVVPLLARGIVIGVCSLGFFRPGCVTSVERVALTALQVVLGEALDRTRLREHHNHLAERLQQTLLPQTLAPVAGLLSAARYAPAAGSADIGGDWYDLIRADDDSVIAVIGDVEGHSSEAAVVMGQLRSAVRAYAAEGYGPAELLTRSNRLLLDLEAGLLATCCVVRLDLPKGIITAATAGHPLPFVHDPSGALGGNWLDVGPPLGTLDSPVFTESIREVRAGTHLVLYTDGVTGFNGSTPCSVFARVLASADQELETVADRILDVRGAPAYPDDRALLLLRYEGPPGPDVAVGHVKLARRDFQGVRHARLLLTAWLGDHKIGYLSDQATLLLSEVVTNALVHGDSEVDIQFRKYRERLHVAVRDNDLRLAAPIYARAADDEAEGGRGLLIVSALAEAWGNSPNGQGKTVWFNLPLLRAEEA
ncbi:SpoIIE family protein phosphatase [Streptomyces sp. NPDC090080]|uniref:ATP-binding SpoIIE family protein phosphatase n=1 Tax=Streptomyces sp. NPDC090080 TaxID=3365939 RepID=UPI003826E411